jgi:hypothetical protein
MNNDTKCLKCKRGVADLKKHLKKEHLLTEKSYEEIYVKKTKLTGQRYGKLMKAFYEVA